MQSFSIVQVLVMVLAPVVIPFLLWVLYHFHLESRHSNTVRRHAIEIVQREVSQIPLETRTRYRRALGVGLAVLLCSVAASAQSAENETQKSTQSADLEKKMESLQRELDELKSELHALHAAQPGASPAAVSAPVTTAATAPAKTEEVHPPEQEASTAKIPSILPGGATVNVLIDGYYGYNTNHPAGRVNSLRAYDVLSNSFSLNQAAVVFELLPDLEAGRRFGGRLDLQFGQATATLQGNPANEARPDIYRNIFQAYGRYIAPVGKGLTVDFGKWASSLGYEANYTKDQLNYTRSYYAYFLPFYHMGVRANYQFNDKVAFNYWLTNGTQQTEAFNSFKDEMFGFNVTPTKTVNWTINYYLGQEHPDTTAANNCTAPLQPGLCVTPIANPPNGKTHIFDSYASWQMTPKFLLGGEADYEIQRQWANASPGQFSAPSHVIGGAGYASYQFTPKTSLSARAEYLSDRGGLFSGTTQALKETTATYTHRFGDGFQTMVEYRRDWSNRNFFPRGTAGVLVDHQDTATVGLIWWYGGKQGTW